MPSLGDVALLRDQDVGVSAGGAFVLDRVIEWTDDIDLGTESATVIAGTKVIVVRGVPADDYETALHASAKLAQQGLDLLSIRGRGDLVVHRILAEHLCWWPTAEGLTIRLTSWTQLSFSVPPVRAVVYDSEGKPKPQPWEQSPQWHPSFRYWRLAQVTTDLVDAFRNVALALESILDSIALQVQGEREGDWFERALREAGHLVDLSRFVPEGTRDPVRYLHSTLYEDTRSPLAHAKRDRPVIFPHDVSPRAFIVDNLRRASGLYLDLVQAHLGVRRMAGGLMRGGFLLFTEGVEAARIHVSPEKPGLNEQGRFSDAPSPTFALPTEPLDRSGLARALFAQIAVDELPEAFRLVQSALVVSEDGAIFGNAAEAPIDLQGAGMFEVLLGLEGRTVQQPRYDFIT